jgi:hypothetical protein
MESPNKLKQLSNQSTLLPGGSSFPAVIAEAVDIPDSVNDAYGLPDDQIRSFAVEMDAGERQ